MNDIQNNFIDQKEKKGRKSIFFGIFFFVMLSFWFMWRQIYVPQSPQTQGMVTVTIEEGMGIDEIANFLVKEEVIDSAFFFKVYTVLSGNRGALKAGEYSLAKGSSISTVVVSIVQGEEQKEDTQRITLIEGWRSDQIINYLQSQGLETDFERFEELFENGPVSENLSKNIFEGKPKTAIFEGYLFPDTYEVYVNVTAEDLLARLMETFDAKITPEMWDQVEASPYTFYEILTLASIVEKEVSSFEDRQIVAGIFLQRLKDNYPLQSDATVNYVTGKKTTRPSLKDLDVDSFYNTYEYPGLPPTPISNPSLEAIQSVLDPMPSNYYFFLTTPENETIFSETFSEHVKNKNFYYPN